jgi:clorobiocin biosynthesis protein CloN4
MLTDLHEVLRCGVARWASRHAVIAPNRCLTYAELALLAHRYAALLRIRGTARGGRVGIYLEKTAEAIAAMQAALRLGAAYVPIDSVGPVARAAAITRDASLGAVFTTSTRAAELAHLGVNCPMVCVDNSGELEGVAPIESSTGPIAAPNDLAYILYTSGSTGTPKGVCISHRNAMAFVDWCVTTLSPNEDDVFANHAPLHFDLSVLDIYAALSVGASVALVPDALSYHPPNLVRFLRERKITIWYSVPTALVMMLDAGLLDATDLVLRTICFAGEVFPIKHLARLQKGMPNVRLLNLYGPTETNVCTYYEVTGSLEGRTSPLPIGRACCGDRVWVEGEGGKPIEDGEEGELVVDGPTVMLGYWGGQLQTGPYRTGDRVRCDPDGNYTYLGRRDGMVKVRGYRIELGEVEAVLASHPAIREVAVGIRGSGLDARLVAFAVKNDEAQQPGGRGPGLVALKELCAERLPRQMNIDSVIYLDSLPRTRNGKVDRAKLAELLAAR